MPDTQFDVCSRALTLIGANPITSFDEGSTESIVAKTHYEAFVRSKLSERRWSFALAQAELNQLSPTPQGRWDYAYQFPSGLLVLHAVTANGVNIDFDIYGDKIFTDAGGTLIADYTYRASESKFSPSFAHALVIELASRFALSLAQDQTLSRQLLEEAQQIHWPRARWSDSQSHTARTIQPSRLIVARK
jgi:hypothetical protein